MWKQNFLLGLTLVAIVGFIFLGTPKIAFSYSDQDLLNFYYYNKSEPLAPEESLVYEDDFVKKYHLTFNSIHGERVTAFLSIPTDPWWGWWGDPPWPCILFLHGYGGDKELDNALLAALAGVYGYSILAIDAQYHGEREKPGRDIYSLNIVQDRNAMAQTIIDNMRGIDYLETRDDIDMSRIGLMGGSMGAILGGTLLGVEQRIKVGVLVVGGGNWSLMVQNSDMPPAEPMREALNGHYEIMAKLLDPVDPLYHIHRFAPRPLLMQNALYDVTVPAECGRLLYEAAGEIKHIDWYPTDHYGIAELPWVVLVTDAILDWFDTYL